MSQNKPFDELNLRKELSKLSKLQLVKRCKHERVSTNNSKKVMIDGLIQKYKKTQSLQKNPIIKAIQKKKRKSLKSKTSRLTRHRSKLVKLFQTSDNSEKFSEFVWNHPDKFVISVIDIILDKTANSKAENDLSTILFHQFRNETDLWLDLTPSIKNKLKRKLLNGINMLAGTSKIPILTHIIAIITSFEEWNELIPELMDLTSSISKDAKLKTLAMIASWAPHRLETYSLQIAKTIYAETLNIILIPSAANINICLFNIILAISGNIDDIPLLMKIMKSTLVFVLKMYVTNYEAVKLFDSNDSNLNAKISINQFVFDQLDCFPATSYDAAIVCFELLRKLHFMHFVEIPLELHAELFFVLNVFLKINANKIEHGLIQFAPARDDWGQDECHFAEISQSLFSVFYSMHQNKDSFDYFAKYFQQMNDGYISYNLIENIVCNINYESGHEAVFGCWMHLITHLDVHYFWHEKTFLVPLLQQKHPLSTYQNVDQLKQKLYEQELFAVRWFVRNNFCKLYDRIHVSITEIILKYLSEYVSIDIGRKVSDEFSKIATKQNQNILQECVEAVINALRGTVPDSIIKEIYCHLTYAESTMEEEILSNYILAPTLDEVVPCIVISPPKYETYNVFNYNVSSIELKLGWFACRKDKSSWPKGGKYYICVQEFDTKNPLEPNNKTNKILFKSKLFTITTQDYEICKLYDINLKLNNGKCYILYVVELDPTLDDEKINECCMLNNTDYSIQSEMDFYANQTSLFWTKSIGLPCTTIKDKSPKMLMTTFVYYAIKERLYHNESQYNPLYDITFSCV